MSNPTLQEFDPRKIKWQWDCLKFFNSFDYSLGPLEALLSGSIGSAKSTLAVHLIALHAINNSGAQVLILRRVKRDLKRTIWKLLLEHLSDCPELIKSYNKTDMHITLINGSEIYGDSYDDMNLEKFRSLELSMAVVEEASESESELYQAVYSRLGRVKGIAENIMLTLTNPDGTSHYLYKSMIKAKNKTKKVFYSLTTDNPFLPKWYLEKVKENLDPKMAQRLLYGQWIDIESEGVYYNYSRDTNFRAQPFKISPTHPIYMAHDFNIGENKPMSSAAGQFIDGTWHWFKSWHVEGARTLNIMEEMIPFLNENKNMFIVNGDATGKRRDTRSIQSDYDIIEEFLANFKREDGSSIEFEIDVPKANPPIKKRHNLLNGLFKNMNGITKLYVYDEWISDGFVKTAFKKASLMLEDDTIPEQHVTTAIGYAVVRQEHTDDNDSETIIL